MYGIISAQLVLTALVAAIILAVEPVRNFVTHSLAFQLTFAFLPLVGAHSGLPACSLTRWCWPQPDYAAVLIADLSGWAGLIPLYLYARKHPQNLIILALWVRIAALLVSSLFCTVAQTVFRLRRHISCTPNRMSACLQGLECTIAC